MEEMAQLDDKVIKAADKYAYECLTDKLPQLNINKTEADILVKKHVENRTKSLNRV
jgi:hypothetical protein